MLPVRNRIRTSAEFATTVRSGARFGRRNLVLYTVRISGTEATKAGFIVSKSVGNAITRNLVKRRLRELAAVVVAKHPTGLAIVARALPPASNASWQELSKDFSRAWSAVQKRLGDDQPD